MDRSIRQKMNQETLDLNCMLEQMNLTDIHRTIHSTALEYTFFSSTHETLHRIDHMLGHTKVLIKLRLLKSDQASFSNHTV